MSNIWADTFSEIREPHLSEEKKEKEEKGEKKHKEGPAEEKAEKDVEKENDKPKRWWDDDGDGKGYEKGEVSGKFPKKKVAKEERELHSKNGKNDKLDVRRGIKNKINTKPTVSEEVDAWMDELIAEGYDLSKFTLDEIVGIYESVQLDEGDTYGMPAKGDAERQKADPMAAAKRQAARAKVSKERADFQVAQQAQRLKVSTTESVLAFVESRTPLFEARFDPKKSKLRPASERTQNAMTDSQRKAKEKEAKRTSEIHSKGETVLAGLRPQGKKGKVQTTPAAKPAAPSANRTVKGKYDKLAKAADKILKDTKR
jgi:hypothetical protein